MYGLILQNIARYVKDAHGPQAWNEIKFIAGIEEDDFALTTVYGEAHVYKIIWALEDVTGKPLETVMHKIGADFYSFIASLDYHKIIRVLGRNFTQFLNGLDNLHEYLRFTFPNMTPPSFYCEHESRTGLTLHYRLRSKRRGFLHYVKGIIETVAMTLYEIEVKIELLDNESEEKMQHVILRLHFNNIEFSKNLQDPLLLQLEKTPLKITSDIFFDIFPFIIVFNRGMRIRNIGLSLFRILPRLIGKKFNQSFVLVRPFVGFKWESVSCSLKIMSRSNNIFEIMTIEPVWDNGKLYIPQFADERELQEERRRMPTELKQCFLTLKGQMMYMEEWESICFLGIPVFVPFLSITMSNLKQMYNSGLFINDFATHDSSRDLVLASTQQAAELKLLLDQEELKAKQMKKSVGKLQQERARIDRLLYQLLPRTVADQLRKGVSAVATCESFDRVTMLFTDIVGFTTICGNLQPIEVVNFLNDMYMKYDEASDRHALFKVETIGDAYMAVSGAPRRTDNHAEYVCDCALDLVQLTKTVNVNGNEVRIRAGVHTGSVVAGVVGVKMPRYCLFGENVMIANKMESSGAPMRVQISVETKKELDSMCKDGLFVTSQYREYEYQPGSVIGTYWMDSKTEPPRAPTPQAIEEDEEIEAMKSGRRESSVYSAVGSAMGSLMGSAPQTARSDK